MFDRPEENNLSLSIEFRRERSIRRVLTVLETKRQRIRDDLEQLIAHIALLMPPDGNCSAVGGTSNAIADAADRLGDDAFAQLLLQILQEGR